MRIWPHRFSRGAKIEDEENPLNGICLVARTNRLLKQYESVLNEKGMATFRIRRSDPEDRAAPGIRLATMHRVKGLEFDRVIIAGVNEGIVPFEGMGSASSDPVIKMESEVHERALLYVSATRAKREVLVTSFGKPSKFLGEHIGDNRELNNVKMLETDGLKNMRRNLKGFGKMEKFTESRISGLFEGWDS